MTTAIESSRANFAHVLRQLTYSYEDSAYSRAGLQRQERSAEVANELLQAYEGWIPDFAKPEKLSIFAPGLLTSNKSPMYLEEMFMGPLLREWQKGLLHLCLYVDRVWVPDPLEILAFKTARERGPSLTVHEPLINSLPLALEAARILDEDFSPLTKSGVIVLYPPIKTYKSFVAQNLFGESRWFRTYEMSRAWPDLYVAEGLEFARAFKANYAALHSEEFSALIKAAAEISSNASLSDMRLIAALPRMSLPSFEGLDPKTLASVRSSEQTFDDFRVWLRDLTRSLVDGLDDPGFDREVGRLEKQNIEPSIQKLLDDVTRNTVLKSRLSDAPIDFAAGAIAGLALKGDVRDALLAGTMSALAKALVKILAGSTQRARPAGSAVFQFHCGTMLPRRYRLF